MNKGNPARDWYNKSYASMGFSAQRRYPNEELCRFMGRNYFSIANDIRSQIKILEVGCGSGANLWMIAKEGFSAYGQDLSEESLVFAAKMLNAYNCSADLRLGDMCSLHYGEAYFDGIVDVFSSYCLTEINGSKFIASVSKSLKKDGKFFSYFPSKVSHAFKDYSPSTKLDASTLDGIQRVSSPFCGNNYPFRFIDKDEYRLLLIKAGLEVVYLETVDRSYLDRKEIFQFVVVEAIKVL